MPIYDGGIFIASSGGFVVVVVVVVVGGGDYDLPLTSVGGGPDIYR